MSFQLLFYKGDKEVIGTLRGFDEYVNMVLDDVTEYEITPTGRREVKNIFSSCISKCRDVVFSYCNDFTISMIFYQSRHSSIRFYWMERIFAFSCQEGTPRHRVHKLPWPQFQFDGEKKIVSRTGDGKQIAIIYNYSSSVNGTSTHRIISADISNF